MMPKSDLATEQFMATHDRPPRVESKVVSSASAPCCFGHPLPQLPELRPQPDLQHPRVAPSQPISQPLASALLVPSRSCRPGRVTGGATSSDESSDEEMVEDDAFRWEHWMSPAEMRAKQLAGFLGSDMIGEILSAQGFTAQQVRHTLDMAGARHCEAEPSSASTPSTGSPVCANSVSPLDARMKRCRLT